MEHLGTSYNATTTFKEEEEEVEESPLLGLDSLYPGEGETVDAETIWNQLELQNTTLIKVVKKSMKILSKHMDGGKKRRRRI
eukprot:14926390-Ditylum_brightwellii.AAC.1